MAATTTTAIATAAVGSSRVRAVVNMGVSTARPRHPPPAAAAAFSGKTKQLEFRRPLGAPLPSQVQPALQQAETALEASQARLEKLRRQLSRGLEREEATRPVLRHLSRRLEHLAEAGVGREEP